MCLYYLIDRVFGCHLATLCKREGGTVPKFVKLCIEAVEKRGRHLFINSSLPLSFELITDDTIK